MKKGRNRVPARSYRQAVAEETKESKMTIDEAVKKLNVPVEVQNVNTVQDAQWRLRDALKLASRRLSGSDDAPSYVLEAVRGLDSWINHKQGK
jgi:hypothetical protein